MLKHFGVYQTTAELEVDVLNEVLEEPWIVYISSANMIKFSDGRLIDITAAEQQRAQENQNRGSLGSAKPEEQDTSE